MRSAVPSVPVPVAAAEECARAAFAEHRDDRGPLMPILHTIQERLGCVPAEVVPALANLLNISIADVHGVVSFYHDFRSTPAATTVLVCRAEACQSLGGQALADYAQTALGIECGEVTADGQIRLDKAFCLGNCALGPSVMVDEVVHGRVSPARLDALLGEVRTS